MDRSLKELAKIYEDEFNQLEFISITEPREIDTIIVLSDNAFSLAIRTVYDRALDFKEGSGFTVYSIMLLVFGSMS